MSVVTTLSRIEYMQLHSFNKFSEISFLSKITLILICVSLTLATINFVIKYAYKNSYKLNFYDYLIAIILSSIACLIFPIMQNGGWNWFAITGICTGMIFLKSIKHLL